MSKGSSLPYRLRPNKAVDRELFFNLLSRLAATLRIEDYQYIGLGGAFLEDFRLAHARLGIDDLICVEADENVHKRQKFNRPVDRIECINSTLEEYIDSTDFEKPVVIWFDYTKPRHLADQVETFCRTMAEVSPNSVLRVTLNADPASLGNLDKDQRAVVSALGERSSDTKQTEQEWRLDRFRERLGRLFPNDLKPDDMKHRNFGKSVLKTLRIEAEKSMLSHPDRRIVWALATHYADGQPMATATVIVCSQEEESIETLVGDWEYSSTPDAPLLLDMPALSTLERLTMESCANPKQKMGFALPSSDMRGDPFESFKRFYRVFPHFSRVEL